MASQPTPDPASLNQTSTPIEHLDELPKIIKRVGVIGGGQLAWMMAGAADKLGIKLFIQTPQQSDPAVSIAAETVFAQIDDAAATAQLASCCDVITFENEFINLPALMQLAEDGICFRPRLEALLPLLDKYDQRCYFEKIGIPQPHFMTLEGIDNQESIKAALNLSKLEFPCVLKARRHGYDGQGTFIIKNKDNLQAVWQKLNYAPVLLEEFIAFERELAVVAARSATGEVVVYPVVETQQEEQVCRRVFVPAEVSLPVAEEIKAIAHTLLHNLQVVGVFGIELFLTKTGKVLVNEVSPRTHNSGHYTLDACATSQFEQQLRAVSNLPLGSSTLNCAGAVMVNLLGYESSQSDYLEKRQQLASLPGAFVHWYNKTQSRPGRKLGHVTVRLETQQASEANSKAQAIEAIWYG
ncbi:MAG: 5-(carboxyamino)imidazole ribonucleotide synthase [Coleofasciculaceae cyanobacterium]